MVFSSQYAQQTLDLEFSPADAVTLVPVYLSGRRCSIWEANDRDTLHLSPAPAAVDLSESLDLADPSADCDDFFAGNVSDDFD